MSAFSRGLFLRPRCPLSTPPSFRLRFSTTQQALFPRLFSTCQLLHHAAKKTPRSPPRKTSNSAPNSLLRPPTYQSFADSLAAKSYPTLLYAAPPHTLYILSSYTAAAFFFSYAAYNFNAHYLHAPPDLAPWVSIAFGGVCFLVACFGGWLVLAPARLVKAITAIPSVSLSPSPSSLSGPLVAGRHGTEAGAGLGIEVELRKILPLPFFPARKIIAKPEEMTLNYKLYTPVVERRQSAAERLELKRRAEKEHEEERKKSIWTAPFRHANTAFYNLFVAVRRTWTREGFLELGVKGQVYKLDITGGWALDEGKALDRLVRVKL